MNIMTKFQSNTRTILASILFSLRSESADIKLQWDASISTNVTYRVYSSTNLVFAGFPIQVGTNLTTTISNVVTKTYFIATAANDQGESEPSNVAIFTPIGAPSKLIISTVPRVSAFTNAIVIVIEDPKVER